MAGCHHSKSGSELPNHLLQCEAGAAQEPGAQPGFRGQLKAIATKEGDFTSKNGDLNGLKKETMGLDWLNPKNRDMTTTN